MVRVVVIAGFGPSLVTFRGLLLDKWVKGGHEVITLAPDTNVDVIASLRSIGVCCCSIQLDRVGMNPFHDALAVWRLTILLLKIKPDVVFSYTIKPVIYGSLAARLARVPRIYSMITGLGNAFSEGGLRRSLIARVVKFLYRFTLHFNANVVFQNPDDGDYFVRNSLVEEDKVFFVNGSGIDLEEFTPVPYPDECVFLLIARLVREKGVCEFAEAARRISIDFPNSKFLLVGWLDSNPGSVSQSELDSWINLGFVDYLGEVEDVRPVIMRSSVFVLPSYYGEGVPRTILEAMAMGRPIITTNLPGCKETVLSGHNGYLVAPRNVEDLVEVMKRFINDKGLIVRMGERSRALAREKFDVNDVNNALTKLVLE